MKQATIPPEDGGYMFLRNADELSTDYMALRLSQKTELHK
jgi:hypothetical protein